MTWLSTALSRNRKGGLSTPSGRKNPSSHRGVHQGRGQRGRSYRYRSRDRRTSLVMGRRFGRLPCSTAHRRSDRGIQGHPYQDRRAPERAEVERGVAQKRSCVRDIFSGRAGCGRCWRRGLLEGVAAKVVGGAVGCCGFVDGGIDGCGRYSFEGRLFGGRGGCIRRFARGEWPDHDGEILVRLCGDDERRG